MANLIGQYVHYNYNNYLKWGLRRTEFRKDDIVNNTNPAQIFKEQKNVISNELKSIKGKYSQSTIKKMEKQLNYFYAWGQPNSTQIEQQAAQKIKDLVRQAYGARLNNKNFNFNNMSIGGNRSFDAVFQNLEPAMQEEIRKMKKMNITKKDGDFQWRNKTAIENRIATLQKVREQIQLSNKKNAGLLQLEAQINQLEKDWNFLKSQNKNSRILKSNQTNNFIKDLNNTIADIKLSDDALKGEIAEFIQYVVNFLSVRGLQQGLQQVNNTIIQEFKDSKIRSQKGIASQFIDARITGVDLKPLKGKTKYAYTEKLGLFTLHSTEDKTDLIINTDNFHIPISLKNYNLNTKHNLHILSGRSLIALVQEYTTFLNHYLNVVPERQGGSNAGQNVPEGLVNQANKIMKLTVLTRALLGGVYANMSGSVQQTKKAEFFVVNNSSAQQPKFKIYQMADIVKNIEKNMDLLNVGSLENAKYINRWNGAKNNLSGKNANQRITNLLMQLHQQELKISISPAALK